MANDKLAQVAIDGVENSNWAPHESGWCQVFVRLCYEHVYGKTYEGFRRKSANLTGRAFRAGGLAMTKAQAGALQAGDILYKCPDNLDHYGHVGIFVGNDRIAENSSTSIGRVRGALGFRTVSQFGSYDLIVRLPAVNAKKPDESKPARLILAVKDGGNLRYVHLKNSILKDGRFGVDVNEVTQELGVSVEIRPLLTALGFTIYGEGNHLDDPADRRKYLFIQSATDDSDPASGSEA